MNPARFACAFLVLHTTILLGATLLAIVYQPLVPHRAAAIHVWNQVRKFVLPR